MQRLSWQQTLAVSAVLAVALLVTCYLAVDNDIEGKDALTIVSAIVGIVVGWVSPPPGVADKKEISQ